MSALRLIRFFTGYRLPGALGLLNVIAMLVALFGFYELIQLQQQSVQTAREWARHFEYTAALREVIVHLNPPQRTPAPGEDFMAAQAQFVRARIDYGRKRRFAPMPVNLSDADRKTLSSALDKVNTAVEKLASRVEQLFIAPTKGSAPSAPPFRVFRGFSPSSVPPFD